MLSKSIVASTAAFSLIASTAATYDASASTNLAMYWGNGANQLTLAHFCNQSSVDIIPIGFIDAFPQQTGGLPGENFGNQCYGTPSYPDSGDDLPVQCPSVQNDIPYCQQVTHKKIVLSIGGGVTNYQLTGEAAGIDFANQLWQMYGPYNSTYYKNGGVRPLDRGYYNTDLDPYYQIDIDGFDFDIEVETTDQAAGYIAMIKELRKLFLTNPCKEYIITGAPTCGLPDAVMGNLIQSVAFDALWIQFYNNEACSGRSWVNGNKGLNDTIPQSNATADNDFTYEAWKTTTSGGASKDAKLYIGLPGGPAGAAADFEDDFLWPTEAKHLIDFYSTDSRFGGVMIWEATVAENQLVSYGGSLLNYYDFIKKVLVPIPPKTPPPFSVGSNCLAISTTTSPTTSPTKSPPTTPSSPPTSSPTSKATTTSSPVVSSPSITPPYRNSSSVASTSNGVSTTSSSTQYTTSTVRETKTYTITSCAPTVTNCPAKLGQVTTETIDLYTTVCPVTESEGSGGKTKPTSSAASPPPSVTPYTTSTVYSTKIYTITSCAPTVTNCPAKLGQLTTEIISLYTTICPVTEATSTPAAPSVPGGAFEQATSAGASAGATHETTTLSSTLTQHRTVKVVKSTATVVPVAPYPTGPAVSSGVLGTGTGAGLPTMSSVVVKPCTACEEATTSTAGGATAAPTSSPSVFTGAGSKMGGSVVAVVLAAVVALIV